MSTEIPVRFAELEREAVERHAAALGVTREELIRRGVLELLETLPPLPSLVDEEAPAVSAFALTASNVYELLRVHGARTRHSAGGVLEIGVDDVFVRAGDVVATSRLLERAREGRLARFPGPAFLLDDPFEEATP